MPELYLTCGNSKVARGDAAGDHEHCDGSGYDSPLGALYGRLRIDLTQLWATGSRSLGDHQGQSSSAPTLAPDLSNSTCPSLVVVFV